jgi:hypothetical protein
VAIITGGIIEEWGEPRLALRDVMQEVHLSSRANSTTGMPSMLHSGRGTHFIVWHCVPNGMATTEAVRSWLVSVLPETAHLVREHLPAKSNAYPAEELAIEIEQLCAALSEHQPSDS